MWLLWMPTCSGPIAWPIMSTWGPVWPQQPQRPASWGRMLGWEPDSSPARTCPFQPSAGACLHELVSPFILGKELGLPLVWWGPCTGLAHTVRSLSGWHCPQSLSICTLITSAPNTFLHSRPPGLCWHSGSPKPSGGDETHGLFRALLRCPHPLSWKPFPACPVLPSPCTPPWGGLHLSPETLGGPAPPFLCCCCFLRDSRSLL